MERRNFIKNVIGTTAAIGLASPLAMGNLLREEGKSSFSLEEITKAMKSYFDPMFLMRNVDINRLPTKGLIILADSYELKINEGRNNIFDMAEIVIEKTKPFGFNAKSLREGKMPEGLTVSSRSISFKSDGILQGIVIPGLKDYDVEIVFKRPITINYSVPVSELIKENSFKHLGSDDKYDSYQGENTKARIFINMHDNSRYFIVDAIEPFKIRSADNLDQPAFRKEEFSRKLTDNFKKLISHEK